MHEPTIQVLNILLFGEDARLVETRKWVLESEGFRALTAPNIGEVERIATLVPIDLFLLCDSLRAPTLSMGLQLIHACWPEARLLVLASKQHAFSLKDVETVFHSLEGPARLLSAIHAMMQIHPAAVKLPPASVERPTAQAGRGAAGGQQNGRAGAPYEGTAGIRTGS